MWLISLPAQGASWLGVILIVVQPEEKLGQVRVDLVIANTRQDLEEQEGHSTEQLSTESKSFVWFSLAMDESTDN